MNTGIARALRRFVGGSAIMLAGLAGVHHRLFADIQVPPADVDRVVVTSPEGQSHEITDRASVAGIVRLVRSLGDQALRVPDNAPYAPCMRAWNVELYRGTEHHDGFLLNSQLIFMQGAYVGINAGEALDLHRLLRVGTSLAPSVQGGCG